MTTNVHDFEGMLPNTTATHRHVASEMPTLVRLSGHNGPSVTSGDRVRPLSNSDAACYDSSSSLMKHRSQKRPVFMLASLWSEK